jgi:RimJ/RimL family protein N-acetyltransferase
VIAFIDPGNVASARVAEALGMTFDGAVEFYGEPSTRWSLPAGA